MAAFTWTLLSPDAGASITPAAAPGGADVPRDLLVDRAAMDLALVEGDLVFSTGAEAVLQDVWLALGFFEGEWFLDEEAGLPYVRKVFVRAPNLDELRSIFRERILSRRGVRHLLSLDIEFERSTRTLAVAFRANTDVGELATAGTLTVGV